MLQLVAKTTGKGVNFKDPEVGRCDEREISNFHNTGIFYSGASEGFTIYTI